MTRRTGNVELDDRDYLEIHPDDAERLWISDGDMISRAQPAGPDRDHGAGHRPDRARPRLHHVPLPRDADEPARSAPRADVNTSCPEYKVIAVDVRPIGEEADDDAGARGAGA